MSQDAASDPFAASDYPDLATVALDMADALDQDDRERLDAARSTSPAVRARYDRHRQSLNATTALLSAQPPLRTPSAVADSLQDALRAAAAARAAGTHPDAERSAPLRRSTERGRAAPLARVGGSLRRHAGSYALAAVLLAGLVIVVPRLGSVGSSSTSGTAGSAGAASAGVAQGPSPAAGSATAAATGAGSGGRPAPDRPSEGPTRSQRAHQASPPTPGSLTAPSPDRAPSPGTRATDLSAPKLARSGLTAAARALAADPLAAAVSCPAHPGAATAYRAVTFDGRPAWLAVTPLPRDRLLVAVTRTACGRPEVSRTVSVR